MRKIVAALVATGVLVAGALTAAVVGGGAASAQDAPDDSPAIEAPARPMRGAILDEVLDDLVTEGVITSAQAERITAALEERVAELREEFGDRPFRRAPGFHRGFGRGFGPGIGAMLEDGVLDADELAALPEGHPLNDPDGPAAAFLEDGELTVDELRQLHAELCEQRRGAGGTEAAFTA